MSKIKDQLSELELIAKELVEIGRIEIGRNWNTIPYEPLEIKVYTAENGDHHSASIGTLDIAYFNPTKFEFSLNTLDKLEDYIEHAKSALQQFNEILEKRDSAEIERRIADRKAILKKELAELEL